MAVKAEIEQKQPPTQPVLHRELAALVGLFVGEVELRERPLRDFVDEVQLNTGFIALSSWKRRKEPREPSSGCLGDRRVAELGELRDYSVRDFDLLKRVREKDNLGDRQVLT
ncbi:hypothetical protein GCM10009000_077630 [Halobacterium noricense]|uniref:Transposase n=1 Tax=Haladaptatus pallidirubidus TaxID=1008152 RepID=A0AAV3UQ13_9EURY